MLTANQLAEYFPDLEDPDCESHVAMVHSRFATNTFPGWKRAHPYRSLGSPLPCLRAALCDRCQAVLLRDAYMISQACRIAPACR
jgi:hypothetical protein